MNYPGAGSAVALLMAAALAGCGDSKTSAGPVQGHGSNTSVLGGYGKGPPTSAAAQALTNAQGQPIAAPHPQAHLAKTGADSALALWVLDQRVVAATYGGGTGWSTPQPLEEIYGQASDPRVASNGSGVAMAVWRHTVGNIQSLRYSRYESAAGWAVPEVMPGALPRPRTDGAGAAPQLSMDAQGNATAEWPSGFSSGETQTTRHVPGQGWTRALSEPVAAAASTSPASTSIQ